MVLLALYTSRTCVDWIEHPLHAARACRNEAAARSSSAVRCCMQRAALRNRLRSCGSSVAWAWQLEIILRAGSRPPYSHRRLRMGDSGRQRRTSARVLCEKKMTDRSRRPRSRRESQKLLRIRESSQARPTGAASAEEAVAAAPGAPPRSAPSPRRRRRSPLWPRGAGVAPAARRPRRCRSPVRA